MKITPFPKAKPAAAIWPGCPVCGESKRSYLFLIRGLLVLRCSGCGLVSLDPRSVDKAVNFSRDSELFGHNGPSDTEREAARRYMGRLRAQGFAGGDILLVAEPGHAFAAAAADAGAKIACHLTALDVEAGLLPEGQFDALVMINQLDKIADPLALLQKVRGQLKNDALFLVTVPSVDSWPALVFSSRWPEWRPENLHYFTRTTLQLLLLRAGFNKVSADPDRKLYTIRHIAGRARTLPETILTRSLKLLYRVLPNVLRNRQVRISTSGVVAVARKTEVRERPLCTVVLPVYNERKTFVMLMEQLLAKKFPGVDREIIIIESNSSDGTREEVLKYRSHPEVKVILQDRARGKGNAVREGFANARGDIITIQDADLEYDLNDYDSLLEPLVAHKALFVLGIRHGGNWKMRQFEGQMGLSTTLNFGHLFFTWLINILYGKRMSDPFTMYKLFWRDCLDELEFECNRFDLDHELVIKLIRKGYDPLEIPVNYKSRSFKEGKKVRMFRDPLRWLWVDIKYRFVSIRKR